MATLSKKRQSRTVNEIFDRFIAEVLPRLAPGITPQSANVIDYTSFGQLSGIITGNWDVFEPVMTSARKRAVERVMSNPNLSRGPIAHCCQMSSDEKDRLHLAVKDWFRMIS
jgi:hypothetical protein